MARKFTPAEIERFLDHLRAWMQAYAMAHGANESVLRFRKEYSPAEIDVLLEEVRRQTPGYEMTHSGCDSAQMAPMEVDTEEANQEEQEEPSAAISKRFDLFFTFIFASLRERIFPKDCTIPHIVAGATFSVRVRLSDALTMMFPTEKFALQEVRSANSAISLGVVCVRVRSSEKDSHEASAANDGKAKRFTVYFLQCDAELKPIHRTGDSVTRPGRKTKPRDWLVSALLVTGTGERTSLGPEPVRMLGHWLNRTLQPGDYEQYSPIAANAPPIAAQPPFPARAAAMNDIAAELMMSDI